ncbi:uncharacterized protein si:ch211-59o9.10 [Clupea harengus]|uniref:Uncharacterized protein si:ch211-59o9.10 n=1 Tax=Clupea harengus TaxID=7950 RepID=A0A6P3WGJ7_CLUHA|nr:uncharacterized protein si:ch211-59o9.10 [Clupea harengus]
MSTALDISEPSSPQSCLGEPDTPGALNRACLRDDSSLLVEDSDGDCKDLSSVTVPETPSPLCLRRRVRLLDARTETGPPSLTFDPRCKAEDKSLVDTLCTTPTSHQKQKRRRIVEETSSSEVEKHNHCGSNGFVPASKLMQQYPPWLEVPRPSHSFSSSSSSSILSQSGPSRSDIRLVDEAACQSRLGLAADSTEHHRTHRTNRKRERPTKNASATISSSFSKYAKNTDVERSPPQTGLFHCRGTAAEAQSRPVPPSPHHKHEEIVIIDDDEDDVIVEAMVRSVQVAEDEAIARSLQDQFDREEQQQQLEQRRQQAMHSNRHHPPHPPHRYNPYGGMGWMSAWSHMAADPGFGYVPPTLAELQQAMFAGPSGRHPGHRFNSRSHNHSRRQGQRVPLDLFNDSQGNNYEALLAFEEGQGSVMPKNILTKREIERLPTKAYNPAHSAGKTECQICFCEYTEGEQLRMLPCLHDYHVKCIDRWLKENVTCPICRADVSQTSS